MPPRPTTEAALLDHALEVVSESSRVIAATGAAVESVEKDRLQAVADRDEAMVKLADATEALRESVALVRRVRTQLDEHPPMPHIAPPTQGHVLALALAEWSRSTVGRATLAMLALALALASLAAAVTAGADPYILQELAR